MSNSRTKNTIKNFSISIVVQLFTILLMFVNRTVFIRILNADYLGVNGLFSNVLTILSFAELGIGSAIIFSMYSPVRNNDTRKIGALLALYKKAYRIIAVILLITGLALLPFLRYLTKKAPDIDENLNIIYILFLLNTVFSYCFSYSKSLFTVHQKEYINVVIERIVHVFCVIGQLIFLWYTHNYIGYLVIQAAATLLGNVIIYIYTRKSYKDIVLHEDEKLEKTEVRHIFSNIKAIVCYKFGTVLLTASSNIIIARIINVAIVGVCSNYTLLVGLVEAILSKALYGIVASIGNLNASNDKATKVSVFNELNFCVFWIYGICSIELAILLNKVIRVWLNDPAYVFSNYWYVLAIVLNFYVFGTNFGPSNYRITLGYFKEARLIPICAAVINIVLSIVLGLRFGLIGIFLATPIARIVTFGIADPFIVIKKGFGLSIFPFYLKSTFFFVVTLLNGFLCYRLISLHSVSGWGGLLLDAFIIAVAANLFYLLLYFRTAEYRGIVKKLHIIIGCRLPPSTTATRS